MLRSFVSALVVLLVVGVAAVVYVGMPAQKSEESYVVTVGMVKRSVKGLGRVEGVAEANLSFGRPGRLDSVEVTESQEVELNDILAQMNPSEANAQIAEAEAEFKSAQAKADLVQVQRPPEVIKQAEEKLQQASEGIKAAEAHLKALQDPPMPPPATQYQLDEQTFVIKDEEQNLVLANTDLKKLKSSPTPDELSVADAHLRLAQQEYDGAVRKYDSVKPSWSSSTSQVMKTDAEIAKDSSGARLALAQAEYDRVKRGPRPEEIEAATARVAKAQIQLDREIAVKERLEKPEKPPPTPFDQTESARVALIQARSKENEARAAVEALKRAPETPEIRIAEAALEKAKSNLDWLKKSREGLKLHAPFSGLITRRLVEPGSMVGGMQPIVTLIDFTSKRVRAEFDILRLGEIKVGMHVDLSSKALGKETLDGKIEKILGVGTRKLANDDPPAPKGGEVAEMIITLDEPKSELKKQAYAVLRPGLRMDADVTLDKVENVIVAPKPYVSQKDGKEYVLCLERKAGPGSAETITQRAVTTGMRDEQYAQIVQGLSEGDMIVKPKPMNLR